MKKKLSLTAFVAALLVVLSMALAACGNSATQEEVQPEAASVAEAVSEAAADATEATTTAAAADSSEEVSFKLVVDPGEAGEVQTLDCKAAGTLGDYLRDFEDCDWEESSYGIFVKSFYGVENDDATGTYWMLYVNDESSMVGADEVNLEEGATYSWKYESF